MSVFLFSNVAVSLDVQCKKREHWVIIIIIVLSSSKNGLRSIQPLLAKTVVVGRVVIGLEALKERNRVREKDETCRGSYKYIMRQVSR